MKSKRPTILAIEDEAALYRVLGPTLESHGYDVHQAQSAQEGLEAVRTLNPDLVLLDLGLPDRDGLDVLQNLRGWTEVPVVVLSARHQERDKVLALDQGADDYLAKPFGVGELLARIRVALRHAVHRHREERALEVGALRVDFQNRRVFLSGEPVHLTPLQYRLLEALAQRAGSVATHTQLLREVWGEQQEGQTHYLRIYMAQLRQKLEEDPNRPQYLLTEAGIGYRLRAE